MGGTCHVIWSQHSRLLTDSARAVSGARPVTTSYVDRYSHKTRIQPFCRWACQGRLLKAAQLTEHVLTSRSSGGNGTGIISSCWSRGRELVRLSDADTLRRKAHHGAWSPKSWHLVSTERLVEAGAKAVPHRTPNLHCSRGTERFLLESG